MYTIEEAARRTGVSTHTLRYYERIGLLAPIGRLSSGHRRYSEDDIGAVGFLTLLRQTGMPIRDMLRFVQMSRAGEETIAARVNLLEAHRDALAEQLELLNRHFGAIERKILHYRALLEGTIKAQRRAQPGRSAPPVVKQSSPAPTQEPSRKPAAAPAEEFV